MSTPRMPLRRAVAAMTAGCLAVAGAALTLAGPAGAAPGFAFDRLQGTDRYATAAAIARDGFPTSDVALLANGQGNDPRTARDESHFPDALAGSYLAGFRGAPTLLTTENTLPAATSSALTDLGVETVVIVGGTAAVSAAQEQQLRNRGLQVQRVSGANRYATAAAVARVPGTGNVGSVGGRRTAVVASGVQFPDALVMGPLSYAGQLPLTITDPRRLSPETRTLLDDFDIEQVLIPGGESAVSGDVQREIEGLGISVTRFAGAGRTQTAALVADYALVNLSFTDAHVNLALGLDFPDALAGGPHAGRDRAPILLTASTTTLGTATRGYLQNHSDVLQDGHIFGGTAAISSSVETEAEQAAQGSGSSPSPSPSDSASPAPSPSSDTSPSPSPGGTTSPSPDPPASTNPSPTTSASPTPTSSPAPQPTTVTTRPELVRAAYEGAPTLDDAGTASTADDFFEVRVRYTFDEPVGGKAPVASAFSLVGFDSDRRFAGQSAVLAGSGDVIVTFGRAAGTGERESLDERQLREISLAVVDEDAVSDGASGNPVGARTLATVTEAPLFPAGTTSAPDLRSVTSETSTADLIFEFDESPFVLRVEGFHVITTTNADRRCAGPAVISGTRVHVRCAAVEAGDVLARGFVEPGTVSDASTGGNLNPLQAERVAGGAGTAGPDLVSAEITDTDTVLFAFDGPVFVSAPAAFRAYRADASEVTATAANRQQQDTHVLVTFAPGALAEAVGASVREGAVVQTSAGGQPNQEDEVAVVNPRTTKAGSTDGPDLTRVQVASGTATYTFDEALSSTVVSGKLRLFTSTGTRLTCANGARTPSSGDSFTVTCTIFTLDSNAPASPADVGSAVLGTADNGAVSDSKAEPNPEGAKATGSGTPAS